ncbi:MAG TPA: TRAP transporter small permease [Clostridium sp.]|nr:TRAP transporter small permease [Clostridium sp.]
MKALRNVLDKFMEVVCCFLLVLMTLTATWQVVSRYIFNKPSTWSESVTLIAFVWMALFASAYVFGKKEHMQMTFVFDKFSDANKNRIRIITEVIVFIFAAFVLVVGGFKISMLEMGQTEAALGIPVGCIYLALPLSGVFTCIYNILNLSDLIAESKEEGINNNNSKKVA